MFWKNRVWKNRGVIGAATLVLLVGGSSMAQESPEALQKSAAAQGLDADAFLTQIASLQTDQARVVNLMGTIVDVSSDTVTLTKITASSGTVSIAGLARSNEHIAQLLSRIEQSPWLDKVYLNTIDTQDLFGLQIKTFTMTARFLQPADPALTPAAAQMFVLTREVPTLLKSVSTQARGAGLTVVRFMPRPETMQPLYAEVPVDLELTGSFDAVVGFLDGLARSPQVLVWRDITLTEIPPTGQNTGVRLQGQLSAVRLLQSTESGAQATSRAGTTPIGPAFPAQRDVTTWRNPFVSFIQQALEARAETPPLQRYSLDQLTLLGLDCVEGRALLQDPEGAQHTVAIGEYIGRNWGQVQGFRCPAIVIQEEYQTIDGETVIHNKLIEMPVRIGELEASE